VIPFGVTNGVPCFQRTMDDLIKEEELANTFPYVDNVTIGGVDEADLKRNDTAFQEMIKRRNIILNNSKTDNARNQLTSLDTESPTITLNQTQKDCVH